LLQNFLSIFLILISNFAFASKTIHVFVALCDNQYQGIVKVPAKIGNGSDLNNNLYWGCGYGIRTYFKKSNQWTFISSQKVDSIILERITFKHKTLDFYLVADAYNGQYIKQCTIDFLSSCSGKNKASIKSGSTEIAIGGNAQLLAYIGHDGLMDFELNQSYKQVDESKRDCIILACYSKAYFSSVIKETGAYPLLWTNGLMCPEAYTLHDALDGYVLNQNDKSSVRSKAAMAYSKYQKCSEKAARNLLLSGW
jgi:hypothetical protein